MHKTVLQYHTTKLSKLRTKKETLAKENARYRKRIVELENELQTTRNRFSQETQNDHSLQVYKVEPYSLLLMNSIFIQKLIYLCYTNQTRT